MDRCEVNSMFERCKLLGGLHAMMSAVPAAADGKIRFGGGSEGEERRDQREAEDEQQRDGKKASHRGVGPMLAPEARFKGDGGFVVTYVAGKCSAWAFAKPYTGVSAGDEEMGDFE
jgi:hypothetical protein